MECIVHFEINRNGQTKQLRGLVDFTKGTAPTTEQFIGMFNGMGYSVVPDPSGTRTFKSASGESLKIQIKKLDIEGRDDREVPDRERDALIRNFLPTNNRPL
ncbi:hypothetical protein E0485_07010 [Paenibacillus albiflavus]|uniref:Uncharacterized protein n=1 Tax=Paenibacillus albiflavus TaxID=2545760 RepID=A0A4R4EGA9_9BACL|nr:hypothetical protein [Paenibacillus albiflavus]TCZ78819.1 hypothetical protein E0485_07010 [Paenibacillus albiflavus]